MKVIKYFAALMLGAAVVACSSKGTAAPAEGENAEGFSAEEVEKTAKEVAPTKAEKDSVAYLLGVYFGNVIKFNNFGDDLSKCLIRKGMNDLLKAKGNPQDSTYGKQFKIDPKVTDELFNKYLEKKHEELTLINKEKEQKFLADIEKKGVAKTESGLLYEIIEEGNADLKPAIADTVFVHYKLTLMDGTVLEEVKESDEAVRMMMAHNIEGFKEGLQLIGEGGKIKLYVPSALGYGPQGNRGIEPYSTLTFDVTLDKVAKAAVEEEKAE